MRTDSEKPVRRVLNVRILVGTFFGLMAVWIGGHFWRAHEVRKNAPNLKDRAEALADEKKYAEAAEWYTRYLEFCPAADIADARLRRAEIFEKSSLSGRTIELYRYALASPGSGLAPEKRIKAQRRICELILGANEFAKTQDEVAKLGDLEKTELEKTPGQWHAPGLKALALAGKYRENPEGVPRDDVELAFNAVVPPPSDDKEWKKDDNEPKNESDIERKVYVAPDVYRARYDYRIQKALKQSKDANSSGAYLAAAKAANADLDAALKLARDNLAAAKAANADSDAALKLARDNLAAAKAANADSDAALKLARDNLAAAKAANADSDALKLARDDYLSVLLTAAFAALHQGEAESQSANSVVPGTLAESRSSAGAFYSQAIGYYEGAIQVAPQDPRAYADLGELFKSRGNLEVAMETWERGLKEVQNERSQIGLNLLLVDCLIPQERFSEAESKLKSMNEHLEALAPQTRLESQRLVDLRRGELAFLRGHFDEAINLVTDLASGKMLVQGEESTAKPHDRYLAWLLMGQSNAGLARGGSSPETGRQLWDSALNAFKQAALYEPSEAQPHLLAAEACAAAGRPDAAVTNYQHALEVVSAQKPPPEGKQLEIYDALIRLLSEQKRFAEVELYVGRRKELMVKSVRLTLQGVNEAIRGGKFEEAVKLAEGGVENHPGDPSTYVALGSAHRANKQSEKAAEAYQKAFDLMKDSPPLQTELAGTLLRSPIPGDAAEGEKALRELSPRYAPACLQLVAYLALREKAEAALAVARVGVQNLPKDWNARVAMGTAWMANKDNAKAEAEFQEAVRVAPDAPGPWRALLGLYADTGRAKLAEETLNKMLETVKSPSAELELFRGDMLVRIGDHQDAPDAKAKCRQAAKAAYEKAVELAKDDPAVAMKLAEFLLNSSEPGDDIEAEKLLRRIKQQHDPARRRLAQVLILRGGDAEWEEAQKLLEQSAGDPASLRDRVDEAKLLTRRGGGQNLEKAATICQELLDDAKKAKRPLPGVILMLAQVRELQGNMDEARKQYLALVDEKNPSPAFLAKYIGFLVRHPGVSGAEEAGPRTEQLLKIVPDDLNALELRAHWLQEQKRAAEIEPLIEGRIEKVLARLDKSDTRQEANLARAAGDLFERYELNAAAERWYRRLQKLGGEIYGPLAMSIAKQGRIQEAVALCEEAGKTDDSSRPALAVAAILTTGQATKHDLESAEPYLKKAAEKHKDQAVLQASLAGIYVLMGQPKKAIEQYRENLKQQPKDVTTLSDLATVLAEQPDEESRKEALELVERAIELAGPQPNLLDTKGMALFYDGKPERAEIALQAAAQSPNPDPRYCFHYAVVCAKLGKLDLARTALKQARDGDLEHQLLTTKDRQLLEELKKQVAP